MIHSSTVKKWGNSPSVRIPAAVMKEASLSIDDEVTIAVEDGRIVIMPSRPKEYSLDALLSGITEENIHAKADFGVAAGKELL